MSVVFQSVRTLAPRWIGLFLLGGLMGVLLALMLRGEAHAPSSATVPPSPNTSDTAVFFGVEGYRAGMHSADWDLPNLEHPRVDYWVARFTEVPEMRAKMEQFLERSGRYVRMISRQLDERGMPQDLIFLAMIESGFQPHATSVASAAGIWQFIPDTGRRFGLRIEPGLDERRDPVRSTEAALDYLEYLHGRFGSWYLAAAAYNSGEGRVSRLMRRWTGRERAGGEEAYYHIWDHLPRETRDYVPLMVAAARIAKDAAGHGFAQVVPSPEIPSEEVLVGPGVRLESVAEAVGLPVQDLEGLNPHLTQGHTPPSRSYPVRLPASRAPTLARVLEVSPLEPEIRMAAHRVRRGETLTVIARSYGTSVSAIQRANNLTSDRIRAGQTLHVPTL